MSDWIQQLKTRADQAYQLIVYAIEAKKEIDRQIFDWTAGVLKGDFEEEQTTAQIITNAVISSIPIIGWIADGRDIIANIIKLTDEENRKDFWIWLALVITLIGIIPGVGDAIKAAIKIIARKGTDSIKPVLRILEGLGLGDRIKLLRNIDWADISAKTKSSFNEIMTKIIAETERLLDMLPAALKETRKKISTLLESFKDIQRMGQDMIDEAIDWIKTKTNKLLDDYQSKPEISKAAAMKANVRILKRQKLSNGKYTDAHEVEQLEQYGLTYAKKRRIKPAGKKNFPKGYTDDIEYRNHLKNNPELKQLGEDNHFFKGEYKNFKDFEAQHIKPGTGNDGYLYRVVDQDKVHGAKPAGSYWSFEAPKGTEDQWRAGSAVKRQWNEDGQYVRMKIPEEGLPAMTGKAAPQKLGNTGYIIHGGDDQLYIPKKTVTEQLQKQGVITGMNEKGKPVYNQNKLIRSPWNKDGMNHLHASGDKVWY